MGGAASKWRRAAQKIGFPCASFSGETSTLNITTQNLCTICLEPLAFNEDGTCSMSAVFTGQCSHSFHLTCIASNVQYGSVTCPICRSHWQCLPDELLVATRKPPPPSADPILRILDDSIATSRVNRRFSLRSTRYDDDDPTEPHIASLNNPHCTSLRLSLSSSNLIVSLTPQSPIDLVLVVAPNGSHIRLLKQAIALAVFSLRPTDRLALVTCSPATATRAFALHRMTSQGKRAALHVIDRLFHTGDADPTEGLRKAAHILEDRMHRNPFSCILLLSDSPIAGVAEQQLPVPVHWFHVGFGFGASNGFVMHQFEEFLAAVLGEGVREVQLRIGKERQAITIDELRCGEERRIPIDFARDADVVCISYEYKECGSEEVTVSGDAVLEIKGGAERRGGDVKCTGGAVGPRRSCYAEGWDFVDPFLARRWAKHLHGYRA